MGINANSIDIAYVQFSGSDTIHYASGDANGNTWPTCNSRIGRYALPWLIDADGVTCKKCQKL
jgi:hypothetical protein